MSRKINNYRLSLRAFKNKLNKLEHPYRFDRSIYHQSLFDYLEEECYDFKEIYKNFKVWRDTKTLMTIQEHNTKYGWQHYDEPDDMSEYLEVLDYRGSYIEIYRNHKSYKEYGLTLIRDFYERDEEDLIELEIIFYILWVIHETEESEKYFKKTWR